MLRSSARLTCHLLVAAALAACATTRPIGEWRSETFTGSVDRILIVAVTVRAERRRSFEDQFVAALAARGVRATPSYGLVALSAKLTREAIDKAIEGHDIGAVLITRLAGVEQAEVYRLPANYEHDRDYVTYYDHALRQATPAHYEDYRVLTLETRLYDTASGELVWRMLSETIDSSWPRDIIAEQIRLTIKTLARRGLIAPPS